VRRALVIAYFYPPLAGGGVHRVLSFTRHLPPLGWACTVVCAGERDYWVSDPSLVHAVPPETEVIRVGGGSALSAWLRFRGAGPAGRRSGRVFAPLRALADWWLLPDSYAGWARRAAAAALARVARGGIDLVLSTSPPDSVHLAAREVAKGSRLPWVADFRDPWVTLHWRRPPTPWHAARQAAMETRVLTEASLVLTASRTHAESITARPGGRPRKLLHLPNGFEPAPAFTPSGGTPPAADREHYHVVYTGTLSLADEVGTLLDAVSRLLERDDGARDVLRVDLVGPYDEDWLARSLARGLDGVVTFHGARPHAETRAGQRAADLLLLWRPPGERFRTMVPGKLYEYLASGRPILAMLCADDEAAALVERARGERIPQASADALAAALGRRIARWRATGRAADEPRDWLSGHTRARIAADLARAMDGLVEEGHA